jgi:hypothetical protein
VHLQGAPQSWPQHMGLQLRPPCPDSLWECVVRWWRSVWAVSRTCTETIHISG